MPSFPNLPVLFPDEAVFLNQKGFRPAVTGILPPQIQFFTNPEDPSEIVKKGWDAQSRRVVLDGLANNKSKELGMLGRKGMKGIPNSSLTGLSELSGGAVTKEGRSMARQFLKTRAENFSLTRDASFFSPTGKLKGTELAPPDTHQLFITLLSIADEIQVGNVTEGTLSKLNSAIGSLIQIAPVLSGKQMGQIRDFLSTMVQSCKVLLTRQQLNAPQRRMIASALTQLDRMSQIITEMAKTTSPQAREIIGRQLLSTLEIGKLPSRENQLFFEIGQTPQLNPFEPSGQQGQPPSRRGRPTNEQQAQVLPESAAMLEWLKRGEAESTATGSTGNPRAPGLLSPTSAAVEEVLAGVPSGTTRKLRKGEGKRRGRKY